MNKAFYHIITVFFCFTGYISAQQTVILDVSPSISKSIKGNKELKREKYFNLAANVNEIKNVVSDDTQFDYYFKDLEMTVGRKLGIVNPEVKWSNSVKEDASRLGYADIDHLKNTSSPTDAELDNLMEIFGESQGLASHENHNAYPAFMPKYTVDGAHDEFPSNNVAAAELASNILKYSYTSFQRPSYFEPINEPDWRFLNDQRFYDFHTEMKKAVDKLGLSTKVGGPCYSVSNYYKKEFGNLSGFTNFIDGTNFELDFYSFHTYDYMRWNGSDFVGSITSGLPLESVFDAIAAYTYNEYDTEFKYVASEHGAYLSDSENREQAYTYLENTYFPDGNGFDHEMKLRSIDNYIMVNATIANTMVFMNHPHIVEKSVPFILLETSGWDTYYYSSLLVKDNFDKNSSTWTESRLVDYYRFFDDVKGRRVQSYCDDADIQYHTFAEGNQLICVMKNQSNIGGNISVNIGDYDKSIKSIKLRRLRRNSDFTPHFEETTVTSLQNISFSALEGIVVFVEYEEEIEESKVYDEEMYYSKDVAETFSGTHLFTVKTSDYEEMVDATLRIGLSREASKSKSIKVIFNDETLSIPTENCADRITSDYYATTKTFKIPVEKLKSRNFIQVSFPDGKTGGIGSVIIRASKETAVNSLNTAEEDFGMEIFPNPANENITVKHSQKGSFKLYDLNGNLVKSLESSIQTTQISLEDVSAGIYLLHLDANGQNSDIQKVVVL